MRTQQFLVQGKVQGVGYRRFVERQARILDLKGWTRNLLDGRVEVLARGSEPQLLELRSRLLKGPSASFVESVVVKDIAVRLEFEGFLIEEDGDEPWSEPLRH